MTVTCACRLSEVTESVIVSALLQQAIALFTVFRHP
jgi:hypothetical protein